MWWTFRVVKEGGMADREGKTGSGVLFGSATTPMVNREISKCLMRFSPSSSLFCLVSLSYDDVALFHPFNLDWRCLPNSFSSTRFVYAGGRRKI
jgi:hypothetical protein